MTGNDLAKSTPTWLQLRIPVNAGFEEALINYLFEIGCCGCQQLDGSVLTYFPDAQSQETVHHKITDYLEELSALGFRLPEEKIEIAVLENQGWESKWQEYFKPIFISDRIVVKPTWEVLQKPFSGVVIEIDPKQAFGIGSHATTRLVLQLLEKYIIRNTTILDVGTGTGILAIAATKFNAGLVFALDKDLVAVEAANENIQQNLTDFNTKLFTGELSALNPPTPYFDLILANLNKVEIFKLWSDFMRLLKNSGLLIISGILKDARDEVLKQISRTMDLHGIEEVTEEDWIAFVLKKGSST